jgi:Lon protease-like protein
VLFPGMRMPLHIFEERYRVMVRECVEEDAPFGVVAIRAGAEVGGGAIPHSMGTTTRITQVEYLDDGRMNIFTIGAQRFRIDELKTEKPYLAAEVTMVEQDVANEIAFALMEEADHFFNDYFRAYMALGDQWSRGIDLPDDPAEAADYIAARVDISAQLKQQWLEELSPDRRLQAQIEALREAIPDMRMRLAMKLRQKTTGFGVLN